MSLEQEQFGYIYLTVNTVNKKIYVGQAKNKKRKEVYLGSGDLILKAIEKHGRENFENAKIDFAYSQEELNEKEIFHIKWFRDNGFTLYNITSGGHYGDTCTHNPNKEQIRKNKSEGHLNSEKFQTYIHSEEHAEKMSNVLLNSEKFQEVSRSKEQGERIKKGQQKTGKHKEVISSKEQGEKISKGQLASEKHQKASRSKEKGNKIRKAKTGVKSKRGICSCCKKEFALCILKQFHEEFCLENPNVIYEVEKQRRKSKRGGNNVIRSN